MSVIYNKVTANGTTLLDLSQDTVSSASHIRSGYVGHLNDGTQVTGSYSGSSPSLQAKTDINPTTSSQTIQPDSGYDGLSSVQINAMPSMTLPSSASSSSSGTSKATIIPGSSAQYLNIPTGYNGTSQYYTIAAASGGSGKNAQIDTGVGRVASSTYTDMGFEITVAKAGTYNIYWTGYRSSTSGTSGAQVYVNGTESGNAVTTFDSTYTNVQNGSRTGVSLSASDKVTIRARSRGNNYQMYVMNLIIIEQ